jgi:hypothetical protein
MWTPVFISSLENCIQAAIEPAADRRRMALRQAVRMGFSPKSREDI